MAKTPKVSIKLLGPPQLVANGRKLAFPSRGFVLFALLALAPSHQMTRAHAASLLWESSDTKSNMANMRQLLLRMVKACKDVVAILEIGDRDLRLIAPLDVDVCELENAQPCGTVEQLMSMLDLYPGDLLEGTDLAEFDEQSGLVSARTNLREKFFLDLEHGVKEVTRYGSADASILRKIEAHSLAIDSSRASTTRLLLSAYEATGHKEEASRLRKRLGQAHEEPKIFDRISLKSPSQFSFDQPFSAPTKDVGRETLGVMLPRVALLAPNWVEKDSNANIHRAIIEDAANELARYRSIVALASHSSFQAVHDGGVVADNKTLKADYTVSSFIKRGDGLGVLSIRLVNTLTSSIVWSADYSLETNVVINSFRSLVSHLALEVSRAVEQDALVQFERTGNTSAYLHFLRAQHIMRECTLATMRKARKSYAAAVNEDARFAEAFAGLSATFYFEWLLLGGWNPSLLSEARNTAEKAINLNAMSSAGHARLAIVLLHQKEFDEAEASYERARLLHPNSAPIIIDQADALSHIGDANEALRLFEQALDLNPFPPEDYWWTGAGIQFSLGQYDDAIAMCARLKNDEAVLRLLAASHGKAGNIREAQEYGRRLKAAYPGETAESMTKLQPHRTKDSLQTFIEGLRIAGIK